MDVDFTSQLLTESYPPLQLVISVSMRDDQNPGEGQGTLATLPQEFAQFPHWPVLHALYVF